MANDRQGTEQLEISYPLQQRKDENISNIFKGYFSSHLSFVTTSMDVYDHGQYVLPSAENVNITIVFYADFPFSAENTFLAPRLSEQTLFKIYFLL